MVFLLAVPTGTSSPAWELHIDDVGSCLHLGVSADHKTVAIQRDEKQVEFIDRLTGNIFVEVSKNLFQMLFLNASELAQLSTLKFAFCAW